MFSWSSCVDLSVGKRTGTVSLFVGFTRTYRGPLRCVVSVVSSIFPAGALPLDLGTSYFSPARE